MQFLKSKTTPIITRKTATLILLSALFLAMAPVSSHAHNLWIVGDANNNGDGAVNLYFAHFVGPGDGAYNGPIEQRGKTWVVNESGDTASIVMQSAGENDLKYLSGNTGKTPGSFAVDHASLYGIYHGRLDFFYGRYIEAKSLKDLETLSESQHLPFQIMPQWRDGRLLLKLQYFSKPLARTKLAWVKADGTEEKFMTDSKGEVLFTPGEAGKYHFSSLAFENEAAGAFEYKAFKGIMYATTLTIKLPVE
ncbi:MAG: hypothetical protein JEZ02_00825 [Desulfatibacillum sp.]|nr:hypothetical protein [Desulfatibacillum sp.]